MNDQKTVRLVIIMLGLVGLSVVIGGIVLAIDAKTIPDALIALGAGAVASIGSILAHTSTNEPQPVSVVNPPAEPVPVAEAKPKRGRGDDGLTMLEALVIVLCVVVVLMLVGKL